jgi:hypothetical protein
MRKMFLTFDIHDFALSTIGQFKALILYLKNFIGLFLVPLFSTDLVLWIKVPINVSSGVFRHYSVLKFVSADCFVLVFYAITAETQQCYLAETQQCYLAETQQCYLAETQQCYLAETQQCYLAETY